MVGRCIRVKVKVEVTVKVKVKVNPRHKGYVSPGCKHAPYMHNYCTTVHAPWWYHANTEWEHVSQHDGEVPRQHHAKVSICFLTSLRFAVGRIMAMGTVAMMTKRTEISQRSLSKSYKTLLAIDAMHDIMTHKVLE